MFRDLNIQKAALLTLIFDQYGVNDFRGLHPLFEAFGSYMYKKLISSSTDYEKTVPSIVVNWNQLYTISRQAETLTSYGITYTKINNYEFTLDGTATGSEYFTTRSTNDSNIVIGHKYFVKVQGAKSLAIEGEIFSNLNATIRLATTQVLNI